MRIQKVTSGSVVIEIDPGHCLMIAEACGRTAAEFAEKSPQEDALYSAVAVYFEALALLAAVGNYSYRTADLLADWTLPVVRREWGYITTNQTVAAEEVAQ